MAHIKTVELADGNRACRLFFKNIPKRTKFAAREREMLLSKYIDF